MRYLLLFLALCGVNSLFSQTLADYEEVVYLKNGSVIRGIIIEEVPGVTLKIQTREKNLFVYKFEEVEKITKELYDGKDGKGPGGNGRKEKGFNAYIDQGVAILVAGKPYPMNQTTMTFGGKFNRYVYLGGGVGILAREGLVNVPIFLDLRLTLTNTKVAPLVGVQGGYLTRSVVRNEFISNNSYGGTYLSIRPGLGINLKKDVDLNFYTGYIMGSQIYRGNDVEFLHMFTFTMGVKF